MPTKLTLEKENAALRRQVKKLERQLANSPRATQPSANEKNLRAFFNTIDHLLFVLDEQGRILLINDAVTRKLGYTLDELRGQSVLCVHPPERRDEANRIVGEMLAGISDYCPVPLVTKDGQQIPAETRVVQGMWSGQPVIFGITKDLAEIKASEEKFSKVFHSSPAPMAITDVHTGKYIAVNQVFLRNLGYNRDEVVGKTALELDLFVDPQQRSILLARMREQGYLRGEEVLVRTHAGQVRHGIFSAEFVHLQNQTLLLTVMDDVTKHKQVEASLRQSEEQYHQLVDTLDVGLCRWLPDTTLTFANDKYCQIFGIQGNAVGIKWLDLLPAENRQATLAFYQEVAQHPRVVSYEHPVIVQDGTTRHYQWIDTPIFNAHNEVVEFQSVGIDITERKRAEDAMTFQHQELQSMVAEIRQSHNMLQAVLESIPVRVFWKDRDLYYLGCNTLFARDAGWQHPEQLIGKNDFEMGWHDQANLYRDDDREVMKSCQPKFNIIEPQTTPSGETIWLNTSKVPLVNADGTVYGLLGVYEDITERKQAEQALRESEARLKSFLDAAPDAMLVVSPTGKIIHTNRRTETLFGYTQHELVGMSVEQLMPERIREHHHTNRAQFLANPANTTNGVDRTIYALRKNGTEFPIEISLSYQQSGDETLVLCAIRDVTQRKQSEQALRESEARLKLAQSVAHSGAWDYDIVKDELFWTDEYYKLYGISKEIPPSRENWLRFVHPQDRVLATKNHDEAIARKEYTAFDFRIIRPDGQVRWMNAQGAVILNPDNAPIRIIGTTIDITERKQAQDLIQAQRDLARIVSTVNTSEQTWAECLAITLRVSGMDSGGIYLFDANRQRLDLVYHQGLGAAFVQATSHFPIESPSAQMVLAGKTLYLSPTLLGNQTYHRAEGLQFGVSIPLQAQGKVLGCINLASHTSTDMPASVRNTLETIATEVGNVIIYLQTLDALRDGEERYRSLVNLSPDGIVVHQDGKIVFINPAGLAALGITSFDQAIGLPVIERIHPDHRAATLEYGRRLLSGQITNVTPHEDCYLRMDGTLFPVETVSTLVTYQGKTAVQLVVRDITERKQAEETLKAEQLKFASVAATVPGAICTFLLRPDNSLCIPYASKAFEDVYGLTLADVSENINALAARVPSEQVAGLIENVQQSARTLQPWHYEYQYAHPTKGLRWLEGYSMPVREADGSILWHGISIDVTERKRSEQQRERQAARIKILHDLDSAILANHSPTEIASRALELIAQIAPFDLGAVILFDSDTSEAWLIALRGEQILPYTIGARGKMDPHYLGIMEQTGTWITSDAANRSLLDPLTRQIITVGHYASLAHTAMQMDGPIFGGIRLFAHAPNAFVQEHAEILTEVANQLAIAIAQTRLREQIEKHTAELEARVQERTAQVQDLYDNAPAGYHSLDANGNNVMINQTELNWLGYTREELIGRPITDLLTPAGLQVFRERFPVFRQQGIIKDMEFEFVRKDGSILPVLLNATAVYDEQGNIINSRATVVDNTERKKADQVMRESRDALNLANRELARASKLKDEFLANMSHELRTPLNAVLGLSESLIEQLIGPLNERQLNALRTIETSGRHLLSLINDILDLSKIEAGNEKLTIMPIAVKPICDASLLFIKQAAYKKQIRISSTVDLAVEWIEADDRRLKQMLVNLLGNAVKFTPPEGQITLQVTGNSAAKTVNFSVRDTGIGIAAEEMRDLFKPFVQLDGGLTRAHEGTGLGLALVARMAEMHGGSVSVESERGKGSCFTVTLPWSEEMQSYTGARPILQEITKTANMPTPTPTNTHAPLILIAEDNEANIVTLSMYLQAKRYRLLIARHGGEALDMARSEKPALILMDLQMPILDGLEATRRLRRESDPKVAQIPIIALTALAMPGDRERALAAGVNDYLSKPVNLKNLSESIERFLKDK